MAALLRADLEFPKGVFQRKAFLKTSHPAFSAIRRTSGGFKFSTAEFSGAFHKSSGVKITKFAEAGSRGRVSGVPHYYVI